ncbi:MAG: flagellar FlbD family protein [Planctomycetota bacterium]
MIRVTRISGEEFVLNAELIQYVEARPDTIITLVGKERVIVKESLDEIIRRVIEYGRALRSFPPERL